MCGLGGLDAEDGLFLLTRLCAREALVPRKVQPFPLEGRLFELGCFAEAVVALEELDETVDTREELDDAVAEDLVGRVGSRRKAVRSADAGRPYMFVHSTLIPCQSPF